MPEIEFRGSKYSANMLSVGQIKRHDKLQKKIDVLNKKQEEVEIEEFDKITEEIDTLYSEQLKTIFGERGPSVKWSGCLVSELEALASFFGSLVEETVKRRRQSQGPLQNAVQSQQVPPLQGDTK